MNKEPRTATLDHPVTPVRPAVHPEVHDHPESRPGKSRKLWLAMFGIVAIAAAVWAYRSFAGGAATPYTFAPIERGDVTKTITATGKLQALTTVQVGSQVSGTIAELYADFNTHVKKGQVIARLDQSMLQAQLQQYQANLVGAQSGVQAAQGSVMSAQANVAASEANRDRLKAAMDDAQSQAKRNLELFQSGVLARQAYESSKAAADQAVAQYQQGIAQINQAKAQFSASQSQLSQAKAQQQQAQAQVSLNQVNLSHTVITAPIDGVVVARNVDVGQTVAASLQAPVLFLIANDLTLMQVLADIDEADVGQLGQDSKVVFTVDAFPKDTFEGRISQIRLNPNTVQNVTTYTAVIDVSNPDMKLRPGMTANVTATVAEANDTLRVPNAALRFKPEGAPARGGQSTVWKDAGEGKLTPVRVRLGVTDGVVSQLVSGDLHKGDKVAIGQTGAADKKGPQQAQNPFGPQRRRP